MYKTDTSSWRSILSSQTVTRRCPYGQGRGRQTFRGATRIFKGVVQAAKAIIRRNLKKSLHHPFFRLFNSRRKNLLCTTSVIFFLCRVTFFCSFDIPELNFKVKKGPYRYFTRRRWHQRCLARPCSQTQPKMYQSF